MAICICENLSCTQEIIGETVYCVCATTIPDVTYPEGCTLEILENGNAVYHCTQQIAPTIVENKTPIYFDDTDYFEDVSWTISYKLAEGSWNSYQTFYPDYSIAHNGYFQIGYNWGAHKNTLWNHLLNNSSFCVFQGEKHTPAIEFIVANKNVNKILNSISLNIEAVHYQNEWDSSVDKNVSFKNMYIYNRTNNTGMLGLNPQLALIDSRKYPKLNGNIQDILFTSDQGGQNINYLFNRVANQSNNIPQFNTDVNNIFKTINTNAVKFGGKRVLERMRGEYFTVHLEGMMDSRYGIILKNIINDETIYE
jgi:hypothetical protein